MMHTFNCAIIRFPFKGSPKTEYQQSDIECADRKSFITNCSTLYQTGMTKALIKAGVDFKVVCWLLKMGLIGVYGSPFKQCSKSLPNTRIDVQGCLRNFE